MAPWEDFSLIFCPYLDIWGLASPTMHGEELTKEERLAQSAEVNENPKKRKLLFIASLMDLWRFYTIYKSFERERF